MWMFIHSDTGKEEQKALQEPQPGVSLRPGVALGHTALPCPGNAEPCLGPASHLWCGKRGAVTAVEAPCLQNPSGNLHGPARLLWAASAPALWLCSCRCSVITGDASLALCSLAAAAGPVLWLLRLQGDLGAFHNVQIAPEVCCAHPVMT